MPKINTSPGNNYNYVALQKSNKVKHGYSERVYNELTLTGKGFSFPMTI